MPANEGHFTANEFAAVPQGQVRLGYDLTSWIRVTVGYDALYVSNVIRPGDQINRDIPTGQTFQQDGTPASATSPATARPGHFGPKPPTSCPAEGGASSNHRRR
jgi:Putative beta barrel porin-7 (BBP7)